MFYFLSPYHNPALHLAFEEYLLKNTREEYCLLYVNSPCIIIGKHQIPAREANLLFSRSHNISVYRRLSGGGAVYHDEGNLNFSFIVNADDGKQVNFRKYAGPVVDFLNSSGAGVSFNERNDITARGKKISGNAEHVTANRVLHHGTLLISSGLDILGRSLHSSPSRFKSKAVGSIRSVVTNLSDVFPGLPDISELSGLLISHLQKQTENLAEFIPGEEVLMAAHKICREKYEADEWTYGYSPEYDYELKASDNVFGLELKMNVDRGMIRKIHCHGGNNTDVNQITCTLLKGCLHKPAAIEDQLSDACKNSGVRPF
ncbi:MAG: lipoate--protein ligase [Bacteroidota bacterium]